MARAERRTQLLKVARAIIARKGLAALTMSALSERGRVARPVVYSHFANRHEVTIALLDEHFRDMDELARKRIAGAKTLDEYLTRVIDGSFDFEMSSITPVRNITNGFSAGDEVNQAYRRHEQEFRRQWRVLLEMQGIRADIAEAAAHGLLGMMNSIVFGFANGRSHRMARETLKTMIVEAIHGLKPARDRNESFHALMNFDRVHRRGSMTRGSGGSRGSGEKRGASK